MAGVFNDFQSPAAGTTLTTGNTSNADGSAAFDAISIVTGGTLTADTTHALHGSQALKVATGSTAGQVYAQWDSTTGPFATSATTIFGRLYCYFTANPPSGFRIMQFVSPTNVVLGAFAVNTSGKLVGLDSSSTVQVTATGAIPLNAWFRVEVKLVVSATAGIIEFKRFDSAESTTPTETQTVTGQNTGTGAIGGVRIGAASPASNLGPAWFDSASFSDVAYPGPFITPTTGGASIAVTASATASLRISTTAAAAISVTASASSGGPVASAAARISVTGNATPTVSPINFVASTSNTGNSTVASSANPAGITPGQLLLVHLTIADGGTGFTIPSTPAPAGYTLLGTQTSQSAASGAVGAWYYRWATGTDAAPSITLHASTLFKWAMAVTAYSGGDGLSAPQFVPGIDPQTAQTSHTAETKTISTSGWVVESFGIKSTTNATYTTPMGLTPREEAFGAGGGAADIAVFDTAADATGLIGGDTTISGIASTFGVHATIVIPPQGGHSQTARANISLNAGGLTTITNRGAQFGWGFSNDNLSTAEAALGRPVDFLRDYGGLGILPPMASNTALAAARRCIISMKFKTSTLPNGVPATDITGGKYNTQIDAFGRFLIGLPQCPAGPHIAVAEHEIDAAAAHNSGTDAQLNAAFAYTVARWRALPGWNCLIGTIVTGFNPTTREPLYTPDFDISDVAGIDNPYISFPGSSGDQVVGQSVDWFTTNYPTMPLFIGEWGVDPGTGTQRVDAITAFEAALTKTRYAKVFAVCYWNRGGVALDTAGLAAWALGGQRAQGPIGATANLSITGAANAALKLPVSASATISLTGTANVTSSTGASQPAANITLTGAAVVTLPTTAATAAAAVTLTGAVTAPVVGSAAAAAFINLGALSTATGAFIAVPVTTGATIALFASAIGPPITTGVVPVNIRARIVDDNGNFELDISGMLAKAEIVRGRTSPNETTIAAATATLTLDDTDGTFDPDNTTSALVGRLEPAPLGTATLHLDHFVSALGQYIDLFTGGIESLDRIFTGGDYSETTGVFVDQTLDLSKHKLAAGTILPAQLPGDRIAQLIGMPSRSGFMWQSRSEGAATQLDRGQKMLGAYTCDGSTSSWDIAVGAAAAEDGLIYFDESGVLVFSGQADRLTTTPVWAVGDQPSQIPAEVDLAFRHSNDDTIVDVAVSTQDGVTALYGPGGLTTLQPGVQFNADVTEQSQLGGWQSAAAKAAYVYGVRSKARRAAPSLHINPAPIQGIWLTGGVPTAYQMSILARISDLLQLTRTPAGGGSQIVANHWIEGYKHTIDASGTWDVTYNVSRAAAPPAGGFWKLGISRLGIDTTLTW